MTLNCSMGSFQFGDFTLDPAARCLFRGCQPIPMTPKEFRTLLVLIEAAGSAVEKETLIREVWPDTYVGDGSLARNISVLRKHLGEDSIQTVPKYGYRFSYQVRKVQRDTESGGSGSRESPVLKEPVEPELPENSRMRTLRYPGLWLSLVVICLAIAGTLSWSLRDLYLQKAQISTASRIAVLPFRNLSKDSETAYLSDGLAEELITTLGQLDPSRMRVLASGSSKQYSGTAKTPAQISHELAAQYLVDGTVRVKDQNVELSIRLIDGHDQAVIWSGRFVRPLGELQQMQTQIADAIAKEIEIKAVPADTGALDAMDSSNPLAYQAYLHGRFELEKKNVPSFRRALEQFTNAVEFDPNYARAYAGISETYINLADNEPTGPDYAYAKAAALTALGKDENLAEAHRDLAGVLFSEDSDLEGAEKEYLRAIQLNPSDAHTHHWYAQLLIAERRTSEALQQANFGLTLDPLSLASNFDYAFILIHAGRPEEAIRHLEILREREPNNEVIYGYLGRAYSAIHQYDRAADSFKRAMELSDLKYQYEGNWAYALGKNGDSAHARRLVAEMESKVHSGVWIPASTMTEAYIGLGDKDRAFSWLRRCVAEHSCTLLEVNNEPFYSGLSHDPRFAQITAPLNPHPNTGMRASVENK